MNQKSVLVFDSAEALAVAAARFVGETAERAIQERGRFLVALSGGSTPAKMYKYLVDYPSAYNNWVVFVSDERWVPEDDPASNMGAAQRLFLNHVPIPPQNIKHAYLPGMTAASGALRYELALKEFSSDPYQNNDVHLDLVLLGIGDDGHTASLFPGKPALFANDRLVVDTPPGTLPPPVERVTFTFTAINKARNVVILASGVNKSSIVASATTGALNANMMPVQMVIPINGELVWMVDKDAAGKLTS